MTEQLQTDIRHGTIGWDEYCAIACGCWYTPKGNHVPAECPNCGHHVNNHRIFGTDARDTDAIRLECYEVDCECIRVLVND